MFADYRLGHLVNNVAIHMITLDNCFIFENFTASVVDLML